MAATMAASGFRFLETSTDFRIFFGPENPERVAYEALENTYTKTDNILFVVQPENKNIFTRRNLEDLRLFTRDAWQIPHSIRVDSLTNFQHTRADGDDLFVADLVEDTEELTDSRLENIKFVALSEPALGKRLIASDGGTAGILVTLHFPGEDHTQHLPESVLYAEAMAERWRSSHPDLTVALTGLAVMSHVQGVGSQMDLQHLVPVMYALMIALMIVLFRSVSATFVTLLIISFSAGTAVALGAWMGITLNPASAIAPIVILTLAVADSVHILMTTTHEMREGKNKQDALAESLRINAEPVFLTSLTTIIGFLSLNFSDSPPFQDLGNIAAMGVAAAWLFSMTLLPAMISLLPLRVPARPLGGRLPMDRFGNFVVKQSRPLLWGISAMTLLIIGFIPRLELDDRFVKWFDESLPFRTDTDFATQNLTGPYTLEFSIGSGSSDGIFKPVYLDRLDAFSGWLRGQNDVIQVSSYTDIMKRINQTMHGDNPDRYRLPEKRDLAAQYLLAYEMSLPFGLDLNSQINVDRSATRLTAVLDTVPTKRMREIASAAESWLKENAPPAMHAKATGAAIMFAHVSNRNIQTMLRGTALAFLLISATLIFALRSLRLGLISLVPNFLPILITFGMWGILVGEIGLIASVITATSLGLIVDDTVHILSKYNRARREHGLNVHDGIRLTFSHVGTALWVTTLILVSGFLVLAFSTLKVNADMGVLTAMTLASALVLDFLLLPPLLMLMDKEEQCSCVSCQIPSTGRPAAGETWKGKLALLGRLRNL
ncbi:MAG TPA: MMPL family transporter [Nitrospiria bacterium]